MNSLIHGDWAWGSFQVVNGAAFVFGGGPYWAWFTEREERRRAEG